MTNIEPSFQSFSYKTHWNRCNTLAFIGAFLAIVIIFFIIPLLTKNFYVHLFFQTCFILIAYLTIYCPHTHRYLYFSGLLLIIPFIVFDFLAIYNHSFFLFVYW